MNSNDDGFFHYNDTFPPLCIRPPLHQEKDYTLAMEGVIVSYLQESYKDGLKHSDNILPSGLSAGEAAVIYFRNSNLKKKPPVSESCDIENVIEQIISNIYTFMDIDVWQHKEVFNRHINEDLFRSKIYKRKIIPALKAYLKEIDMKSRGYTHKLKNILQNIPSLHM
jgi:hypothetical protein